MDNANGKRNYAAMTWTVIAVSAILLCAVVALAVGLTYGLRGNTAPTSPYPPSSYKLFSKYAVATEAIACSKIGRDIIANNGSVADAAIASMLCVGVVNSQSNGIGGGHVAIIYAKPRNSSKMELATYIAREKAPSNASTTMFVNQSSLYGGLPVAIPGEIKGFHELWKKFGNLPWKELIQPTIDLLEKGYSLERDTAESLVLEKTNIMANKDISEEFRSIYFRGDNPLKQGDIVKDPKLAETMRKIANDPDDFYHGELAKTIAKEIQDAGGIITEDDLANYTIDWKTPIQIPLGDSTVYSVRPPASGVVLALILNILKKYNFGPTSIRDVESKVLTFHRIVEAFKFAYAGRTELGDENFINITNLISNMTSEKFADEMRALINDDHTRPVEDYISPYAPFKDSGTAHSSIYAPDGSAVAMTSTINTRFASLVKGRNTGIIFNNEMDDFSTPGKKNYYGLEPSPSNFIKPGKTPMSSMCPTLLIDSDKKVKMVTGASGGSRITTTTAWVMINSLWLGMQLGAATDSPRLHNQWLPNLTYYDSWSEKAVLDGLGKKGHILSPEIITAVSQSIRVICEDKSKQCIEVACDGRKGGEPFGE